MIVIIHLPETSSTFGEIKESFEHSGSDRMSLYLRYVFLSEIGQGVARRNLEE